MAGQAGQGGMEDQLTLRQRSNPMFTKTLVDEFVGMTRVVGRPRSPSLFDKIPKLAFSKGYGKMLYNLLFLVTPHLTQD